MSAEHPLVSVIIGVYNGERYLAEAIQSVLDQTFSSFELIVVDDGSTDGSSRIAQSFPHVRYIYQPNGGHAAALNRGLDVAIGDLLAFIDADDRWALDKLAQQTDLMRCYPDLLYTVTRLRYFLEPGCQLPKGYNPKLLQHDLNGRLPSVLLARREAFSVIGRFNPAYGIAFDVEWFARAKDRNVPMAMVPEVLTYKRIHDHNVSSDTATGNRLLLEIIRASVQRQRMQSANNIQQGDDHV